MNIITTTDTSEIIIDCRALSGAEITTCELSRELSGSCYGIVTAQDGPWAILQVSVCPQVLYPVTIIKWSNEELSFELTSEDIVFTLSPEQAEQLFGLRADQFDNFF